jgi:hypothetical protein
MPVRVNDAARNAAVDAVVGVLDSGTATGAFLRIYSGTQPATPATAPSGTLLAEFELSDPSFAAAASGSAALDVTPALTDVGLAAADAGWARFLTGDQQAGSGLGVVDGTVATSGAMVNLNTVTISVGVNVEVTSGTISLPASA